MSTAKEGRDKPTDIANLLILAIFCLWDNFVRTVFIPVSELFHVGIWILSMATTGARDKYRQSRVFGSDPSACDNNNNNKKPYRPVFNALRQWILRYRRACGFLVAHRATLRKLFRFAMFIATCGTAYAVFQRFSYDYIPQNMATSALSEGGAPPGVCAHFPLSISCRAMSAAECRNAWCQSDKTRDILSARHYVMKHTMQQLMFKRFKTGEWRNITRDECEHMCDTNPEAGAATEPIAAACLGALSVGLVIKTVVQFYSTCVVELKRRFVEEQERREAKKHTREQQRLRRKTAAANSTTEVPAELAANVRTLEHHPSLKKREDTWSPQGRLDQMVKWVVDLTAPEEGEKERQQRQLPKGKRSQTS